MDLFVCLQASETEILWVLRVSILLVGGAATTLTIVVHSIYGLRYLYADLVYVILFPQFLWVVYIRSSNSYSSLCGILADMFFRLTGGEPLLGVPPQSQEIRNLREDIATSKRQNCRSRAVTLVVGNSLLRGVRVDKTSDGDPIKIRRKSGATLADIEQMIDDAAKTETIA